MSTVNFNEEEYPVAQKPKVTTSSLTGVVIHIGLAQNEQDAEKILLGIFGLLIVSAVAIFFMAVKKDTPPTPPNIDGTPRIESSGSGSI